MDNKVFILIILFLLIVITFLYFSNDLKINSSLSKDYYIDKIINTIKPLNRERKYVYVDLGANRGDSIYNFLGISEKAGGGGKLASLIDPNIVKGNKWQIFGFEGNPVFDKRLLAMKSDVESRNKNVTIHLYNSTVAWTYDGRIDFYLDTVNPNVDFWGSSLNTKHPDVVNSGKKKVNLPCVDIAGLINKYDVDDVIVVKIDIEGAEYDLMIDFIKKNTLRLIDYIAVEFHTFISPFSTSEQVFNKIIAESGIKFAQWNR